MKQLVKQDRKWYRKRLMKQHREWYSKLTAQRGVSIGEMLLAVLIMSLLTLVVAAGSGTAMKVYRTEKAYSESRVLANSVLTAITEELRYASNLTVGGEGGDAYVSYDSDRYGADTRMWIEPDDGQVFGRLAISCPDGFGGGTGGTGLSGTGFGSGTSSGGGEKVIYPYDDAAYAGYRIRPREVSPVFVCDEGESYVELSYDICNLNGEVKAAIEHVRIRLLNN